MSDVNGTTNGGKGDEMMSDTDVTLASDIAATGDEKSSIVHFGEQMREDSLSYGMSVVVSRALPSVIDGNKPIHRRIQAELLGLYQGSKLIDRFVKSANIVGKVMGNLHPHGDSSIYEAMVRLAQPWKIKAVLVDKQGNFGNRDGDSQAAMRYTEAKASAFATSIREDYRELPNNWRCIPNFSNSVMEPSVLPVRVPLLLVNGATGIAYGMATNIPPHNMGEVIDACLMRLRNPEAGVAELMTVIKGPDFPVESVIYGEQSIRELYETGRGSILMSGSYEIVEPKKKGKAPYIRIYQLPYDVSAQGIVNKIESLRLPTRIKATRGRKAEERPARIPAIAMAKNTSSKAGLEVIVELKKDANPEYIMSMIRKETDFEKRFPANMLAISPNGKPEIMTLTSVIDHFLEFRRGVIFDRSDNQLNRLRDSLENNVASLLATTNMDEVIRVLRSGENRSDQKEKLCAISFPVDEELGSLLHEVDPDAEVGETFHLSDAQADYIVERKLTFLARLQFDLVRDEIRRINTQIRYHEAIVSSPERVNEVIAEELEDQRKFATPRITEIQPYEPGSVTKADMIEEKQVILTLTKENYVKITPAKGVSLQNRGGRGRNGGDLKEGDFVTTSVICSNKDSLLLFTDAGRVYQVMAYEINESSLSSRGRPLINYVDIPDNEKVTNIVVQSTDQKEIEKQSLMFVTRKGKVRRSSVNLFLRVNRVGKVAMDFGDSGDSLVSVMQVSNDDDLMIFTKNAMMVRFPVNTLRYVGSRASMGVRGIRLKGDDYVLGAASVPHMQLTRGEREAYLSDGYEWTPPADSSGVTGETVRLNAEQVSRIEAAERSLLIVTENGMGKRLSSIGVPTTSNGAAGINVLRMNGKTGSLVFVGRADDNDDAVLTTNQNQIIRLHAGRIRVIGRATSGVVLVRIEPGSKIVDVSVTPHEEQESTLEDEEAVEE